MANEKDNLLILVLIMDNGGCQARLWPHRRKCFQLSQRALTFKENYFLITEETGHLTKKC